MKVTRLSLIKRQGDFILNEISSLMKNSALSIHSDFPPNDQNNLCDRENTVYDTESSLVFRDKNNYWFRIFFDNNRIASYSSATNVTYYLNSNEVRVYDFFMRCRNNSSYTPPLFVIWFRICYRNPNTNDCAQTNEEKVDLRYETRIRLRNR